MVTERILRLNGDGSIDNSFVSPVVSTDTTPNVRSIVVQPDGKILVAGYFDTFAGTAQRALVRLLPGGSMDFAFHSASIPGTAAAGRGIFAKPVMLANGKIIIAGNFDRLDGQGGGMGVAQLNADGSLDYDFNSYGIFTRPGTTPVRGLVVQSDGRIVAAGRFGRPNGSGGTVYVPLVRFTPDGAGDPSFIYDPTIFSPRAVNLVQQPDGKLVALSWSSVYRFNASGSVDSSFRQPVLVDYSLNTLYGGQNPPGFAYSIDLLSDGHLLIGGTFTDVDPFGPPTETNFGVARLDAAGNLDPTLSTSHQIGLKISPQSFARLPNGSTVVAFGAVFPKVTPGTPFNFAKLAADGNQENFALSSSRPDSILPQDFRSFNFARLADGAFFISGVLAPDFTFAASKFRPDGQEDLGFRVDPSIYGVGRVIPLPDGKFLIDSQDEAQVVLDGTLRQVRISGRVDASFQLDPSITQPLVVRFGDGSLDHLYVGSRILARQPDGKLLFIYLSSDQLFHLVRLNANGALDNSFFATTLAPFDLALAFPAVFDPFYGVTLQPPNGAYTATPPLYDAQVMPDGKIVIAGRFTSFQDTSAHGLVRLNADGSLDTSFAVGGGAQWTSTTETPTFFPFVEQAKTQVDGKLLIAGTFEAFNGTARPGIASLNADGSVDTSFTPVAERKKYAKEPTVLERQPDGSFLLSGAYSFPGETEENFLHINSIGGTPIIGSPTIATAFPGQPFSYQIVASGQPVSYQATGLPSSLSLNPSTGLITGTPTTAQVGTYNVTLTASNSQATSAPFTLVLTIPSALQASTAGSVKQHGSAGEFTVNLPLTGTPGVECRAATNGSHTVVITFNNEVVAGNATVTAGSGSAATTVAGQTMIIDLTGVTNTQTVTLGLTQVTDVYGQALPNTSVSVGFLLGDSNGSGGVTSTDVAQTKAVSGQTANATNFREDFNASGTISSTDVALVKSAAGTSIPPAQAAGPGVQKAR